MYEVGGMPAQDLYHHGVKGMRWGVIRKRDSTSRSKGADTPSTPAKKSSGMNPKAKKALLIGGAAALGVIATYGAYKTGNLGKAASLGKNFLKDNRPPDAPPAGVKRKGPKKPPPSPSSSPFMSTPYSQVRMPSNMNFGPTTGGAEAADSIDELTRNLLKGIKNV